MSDSEPGPTSDVTPDPVLGDHPSGTGERTDPRAVLADWFDDTAESVNDLVDELVATYEIDEGDEPALRPRSDELAEITVETVRRYLRNREAKAGRTDPRQAMTEWFSIAAAHQELPQPFTMLTVAFQIPWGLTSTELAQDAVDAIQRYLRDCAVQADE
ncbi:hypothetical protein AB0F43_31135 [Kribbella sp. NPDC023972]|uniref:hypothetical protein n=1 Tax=Kribbella sp. NPDC023972 TaxID=3154795 RepID=UPI0034030F15